MSEYPAPSLTLSCKGGKKTVLLFNEGSLGTGAGYTFDYIDSSQRFDILKLNPLSHMNDLKMLVNELSLTPWRNFIGLLVTHLEESTINFSGKKKKRSVCHLGHYVVAVDRNKSHLTILRVDGIQNSPSWGKTCNQIPFLNELSSMSVTGHILKQEFGERGNEKAFTWCKDGGKVKRSPRKLLRAKSRRQSQNWESCIFCFLK